MQYRSTHPSGTGLCLGICASIPHTNLGNWSITITYDYSFCLCMNSYWNNSIPGVCSKFIINARRACARALRYSVCVSVCRSTRRLKGLCYSLNISTGYTVTSQSFHLTDFCKTFSFKSYSLLRYFKLSYPFCSTASSVYSY